MVEISIIILPLSVWVVTISLENNPPGVTFAENATGREWWMVNI